MKKEQAYKFLHDSVHGAEFQVLYDPLWTVHHLAPREQITRFRFDSGVVDVSHGSLMPAGALPPQNTFVLTGVSVRSLPPWPVGRISARFPLARFVFIVANKIYLDLPLDCVLWNGSERYLGHSLDDGCLVLEQLVNFQASIDWRGEAPAELLRDADRKRRDEGMKLLLLLEGFRSRPLQ